MERLLWTLDDIVRFAHHPDAAMRDWAVRRLVRLFPDQAAEVLVTLLDDPYLPIVQRAAEVLGNTGDRERYAPALLAQLHQASSAAFDPIALALAQLDCRQALPVLLERLEHLRQAFPEDWGAGHSFLFRALGILGGGEVRQALWQAVEVFPRDDVGRPVAITALLDAALPEDIIRLARLYRSREAGGDRRAYLDALALSTGVYDLAVELEGVVPAGLREVLAATGEWLGRIPPWSDRSLAELERALRRKQEGIFEALLAEAQRIVTERGDDVAGWRLAWDTGIRPRGYARRALLTLLILEALAGHPYPYPKLRDYESALGLALLASLSLDRDDQAWLEQAEDRPTALLEILLSEREQVLADVVEQVVALGPDIAPRLIEMLDTDEDTWGTIRLVRAIEQMARRYPGSCDGAGPLLVAMVDDTKSDPLLEACSDALAAIGPAAIASIGPHLSDEDIARQIYLTGALGEIPCESAAQLILGAIATFGGYDEMQVMALRDIGSRTAIEPLYHFWQNGDDSIDLAETLLVLCQLHGEDRPELPEWRSKVQEVEARLAEILGRSWAEIVRPEKGLEKKKAAEGGLRTRSKHKGIGAKERRKRAAQRREQRRRKKGKR